MSLQLFISYAILFSLPLVLTPFMLWAIRWLEQRLPEKRRAALDQFVRIAVHCIEQTCKSSSSQKKNTAIELVYGLFRAFKLPVPSYMAIDAVIEAVVWEINQAKIPDEFADKTSINTGPIAPIQPPGGAPV